MKVFLVSYLPESLHIWKDVLKECDSKIKILYIPSSVNDCESYFYKYKKKMNIKKGLSFTYCPLNNKNIKHFNNLLSNHDIIFFAGGNTFELVHSIRSNKLDKIIKKYKNNKIFIGESAGAIVLTKTINMASIPKRDADVNSIKTKYINGLNLVDFEISPHCINNRQDIQELRQDFSQRKIPIYRLKDGEGIFFNGNIKMYGRIKNID